MMELVQGSSPAPKPVIAWGRWNRFLLLAASFHFALVYTVNTSPFLNLKAFAAGHERAPFQYRALTAWLFWLVNRLFHLPKNLSLYLPARLRSVDSFLIFGIALASLLLGTYATRRALEHLTGDIVTSRWWALLIIFMSYFHYLLDFGHPCCTPFQLPYDLPSMALFALCLLFLIDGRTPLFFAAFAIATLNRESSLFLVLIYLLYRSVGIRNIRSPGLSRLAAEVLGLGALWLAMRAILTHIYTPLPMDGPHLGPLGFHVFDNILYVTRPFYWASYASIYGFTWLFLYRYGLVIPHAGLRRALLVMPVCVGCFYVVGVFSEIRIFGELISLHVIALALLLRTLLARNEVLPKNAFDLRPQSASEPSR